MRARTGAVARSPAVASSSYCLGSQKATSGVRLIGERGRRSEIC